MIDMFIPHKDTPVKNKFFEMNSFISQVMDNALADLPDYIKYNKELRQQLIDSFKEMYYAGTRHQWNLVLSGQKYSAQYDTVKDLSENDMLRITKKLKDL